MLTQWLRRVSRGILDPVARLLIRIGLTANAVTLIGGLFNIGVGVLLALGQLQLGGVLLIVAATLDAVDGAVARLSGKTTRFGAFFDSTFDRISEVAIFAGLLWHYMALGQPLNALLSFLTLAGSVMVSYTRARAEGLGIDCKVGWFTRVERSIITIAALILGVMPYAQWLLVVGVWWTTAQRIWYVRRVVKDELLTS